MRRLVAGLTGLLTGLVFVVANAGGASASPNLTVIAGKIDTLEPCAPGSCDGHTDFQHNYFVENGPGVNSVTLAGTLNAGGHTFIGAATMKLNLAGEVSCSDSLDQPFMLVACQGSLDATGTISGSGVGSISGTCSASNGTLIQEALVGLVSQATLPFVCSISFNGSAPQPVTFTVALAWIGLTSTLSPAAGVGIG